MKRDIPNSKKLTELKSCYTKISLGYTLEKFEWDYGHYTKFTSFYFLFWTLTIKQAWVRHEI